MGGLFFPEIEQVEACTTVVLSRYGGGMFGYLLSLAPGAGQPAAVWAEGSLSGADAELALSGMDGGDLTIRLADGDLALSRPQA
jgi:hypothetical protein